MPAAVANSKRRILLTAIQHDNDGPSGSSRIAYDEALYLSAAGHKVYVLAPASAGNTQEREEIDGVTLLRYQLGRYFPADPRRVMVHRSAARDVLRRNIKENIDVLHGHAPLSYYAALDMYKGSRTCYTVHSPVRLEMEITWGSRSLAEKVRRWIGLPLLNSIEKSCLRRSDAITMLSEYTRSAMNYLGESRFKSRVHVIPGWVDLERFRILDDREAVKKSLGWPADLPVLFTLRRLVPRMGLDRLLRAVGALRDQGKNVYLVIGGTGPMAEPLKELAASLGLQDVIRFAGRVSDVELPAMYGACDAFVLPTTALECFGLIALEALACGRPVLATPVGAIPEVLNHFEPDWLAKSNDEQGITRLIESFLNGELPAHSPEELRNRTDRLYSNYVRLPELARTILGTDLDVSGGVRNCG